VSRPRLGLDADLAAALEVVAGGLGPLQVLAVHPTTAPSPEHRPASPSASAAGPEHPSLFDTQPQEAPIPATATTDPLAHIPPSRRWRAVLRYHAGARPSPASTPTPTDTDTEVSLR